MIDNQIEQLPFIKNNNEKIDYYYFNSPDYTNDIYEYSKDAPEQVSAEHSKKSQENQDI